MAAATTDVRAWLREQGHEIGERGAISRHLQDEYDHAHPVLPANTVPGDVLDSSYPYPGDPAGGVTAADFPPDDDAYPDAGPAADTTVTAAGTPPRGRGRRGRGTQERKPRTVKPEPRGARERIFHAWKAGPPKRGSGGKARIPLGDWAEETWTDLAWLAEPIPPLSKILTIQAPYAGVVLDDNVKGTVVDAFLQPAARYSGTWRALNGLMGPPVYVAMICATGQRVQVGVDAAGEPVTDFDGRTKMLFQGLRYSLLQMTKISERSIDQIQQRTQEAAERMRVVDMMVESIFGFTADAPARAAEPPYAAPPAQHPNGYAYPAASPMDGTGADPGRL